MRRISTSIRTSLLHDASPQAQRQLNRWSLQSLARLNDSNISSNNNGGSPEFETTYQPQQQHPQRDVAELLLNEVKLRLAKQHSRCLALMKDVDKFYDGILNKQVTTTTTTTTSHSPLPNSQQQQQQQQHPIIIPAINAPVAGKNYQSLSTLINRLQQTQSTRRAVTQIVKNLIILHADTYTLTHQLLPSSSSSPETTTTTTTSSQSPLVRFSPADRQLIASTFEQLRSRHATSVENMADILLGLRRSHASHHFDDYKTNNAICPINEELKDSFLRHRLGIQLLCDHYVALHKGCAVPSSSSSSSSSSSGGITIDCDLKSIVEPAITEASHVCTSHWGWAPDVDYGNNGDENVWEDCRLTLVRPWMHHVLVELLKNAMASCVKQMIRERSGDGGGWEEEEDDGEEDIWGNRPSVTIRARETEDSVLLMIIDEGVGLDEEGMKLAFRFAMTSSHRRWDRLDEQQSYASVQTVPLTGLGVGLPLSRMMLRMFGGDVELVNRGGGDDDDGAMTATTTGCIATIRILKDSSIPEWDGVTEEEETHDREDEEDRMEIGNRAE